MEEKEKEIRIKINELQGKFVGLIWQYCKEYCPDADIAYFTVDGLFESIKYNDKGCGTDSSIKIYDKENKLIIENF